MNLLFSYCYYISLIFVIVLTGISFYKVNECFVDIKENIVFRLIAFTGLSFIVTIVIFVNDIVNVVYALIGYIGVMIICYEGSTIKKISVVMVLYPMVVSINLLGNNYDSILSRALSYKTYIIIWYFALALLWFGIYKVIKDKISYAKQYINDKTWILIDIICITPLISIVSTTIFTGFDEAYKAYLIALVCIISNVGIIFLIQYIIEGVKVRLDNQNYKLQYDYYKSLEEKQFETRKIYHDMNNHLQIIGSYIDNNDIEKAKLYFESLVEKSISYGNKVFCKNSIINAVLNNKYDLIVQNEIDCNINIAIDEKITIDDMDLCSIFANTLDNAIEASLRIKEVSQRKIIVKGRVDKGYFSYSVINNKVGDILTHKGTIVSTKEDRKYHGFGLQNIKDIVNKYRGVFDISYTGTEFSIVVIIKVK
ncbi:GHKL domain-containing protein [Tissierella sp. MB52-C2]|uniref:sensor histidine kinase n=1 Tax=Tissierella sp. MB52-C2 TaxID=3070999 RepID=UPI00280BB325|nr:GHKL domain-containing protein [Tissierella sp. MB52-C2]WMM26426.1 GHKL domain-containing protein [Tissierella sp. MB52-C2]